MAEQNYATYGREVPIGTLRDSTLPAVDEIAKATGETFRVESITPEQARAIRESITRLSPNIERLLTTRI